jgi:hypothetical protein
MRKVLFLLVCFCSLGLTASSVLAETTKSQATEHQKRFFLKNSENSVNGERAGVIMILPTEKDWAENSEESDTTLTVAVPFSKHAIVDEAYKFMSDANASQVLAISPPMITAQPSATATVPPVRIAVKPITSASPISTTKPVSIAVPTISVSGGFTAAAGDRRTRCCCTRGSKYTCGGKDSGKEMTALSCSEYLDAPDCSGELEHANSGKMTKKQCENAGAVDCGMQCGSVHQKWCDEYFGARE